MPQEVERKFLIDLTKASLPPKGVQIRQGYLPLSETNKTVVRVRVNGEEATLTVKGKNVGVVRPEFEYKIPIAEALEMLDTLCSKPLIEKTRYEVLIGGHLWEIDVFDGDNQGLIIAEVELSSESDSFDKPDWITEEVTFDPRYYNSNLLNNPYKNWPAT